jgi:hypothetical protein
VKSLVTVASHLHRALDMQLNKIESVSYITLHTPRRCQAFDPRSGLAQAGRNCCGLSRLWSDWLMPNKGGLTRANRSKKGWRNGAAECGRMHVFVSSSPSRLVSLSCRRSHLIINTTQILSRRIWSGVYPKRTYIHSHARGRSSGTSQELGTGLRD